MLRRVMQFGYHFVYGRGARLLSSLPDRPLPPFLDGLLRRIGAYMHRPAPAPRGGVALFAPHRFPHRHD